MSNLNKFEPELYYITNQEGKKIAVIVPIDEFVELLEDVEDLAAVAERRDELTVSHDELLRKKKARRKQLANLSFEEKVEIVERLQKLGRSVKNDRSRRA